MEIELEIFSAATDGRYLRSVSISFMIHYGLHYRSVVALWFATLSITEVMQH